MLIVNLKLYFVAFDETDLRFKVYLDEQGLTPTIQLNAEDEIDDCIFEKTLDFFTETPDHSWTPANCLELKRKTMRYQ